jgi:tetratricopeptide (TPR) repeat protein
MKTVLELEDLAAKAIKAALAQQWTEAAALNQQILEEDPQNIEASNRLARSYAEQGQLDLARQTYQSVLTLDPYNAIAQKNLTKLEQGGSQQAQRAISSEVFLEEPGKTRSAVLAEPQKKRLESIASGEQLALEARNGRLAVTTNRGGLVGYLDDELASHLLHLIQLGNTYSVHLMSNAANAQVFLRETSQSEQASKFVSFTRSHTSPVLQSSGRPGMADDSFTAAVEEDIDAWESDPLADDNSDSDSDDDFASMSLEAMREEEDDDSSYNSRDSY